VTGFDLLLFHDKKLPGIATPRGRNIAARYSERKGPSPVCNILRLKLLVGERGKEKGKKAWLLFLFFRTLTKSG